jgi:hypothetical protein
MHNAQVHRLCCKRLILGRRLRHDDDFFVAVHSHLPLRHLAIDADMAAVYPLLQTTARILGNQRGKYLVQANAAYLRRQHQLDRENFGGYDICNICVVEAVPVAIGRHIILYSCFSRVHWQSHRL